MVDSVPPDVTKYVHDPTVGDIDHYLHTIPTAQNAVRPFPASASIYGVQHTMFAELASGVGSLVSDVNGTPSAGQALTTSFGFYTFPYATNPSTGSPWSQTDVPTTPIGPKVA